MIEDILPRYQETGTGSKKSFTLPFDPISDVYLKVYLGESLTTDYVINEREVTFGTAPGDGVRVTFVRLVPLDWQDPSLGSINSESINNICTIIVAKMQSLEEEISRCVKTDILSEYNSDEILEQLQNAYDILSSSKNLLESLVAEKTTALTELNNVKTQSVDAINSLASSKESEISDYTETEKAGAKREITNTKQEAISELSDFAEPIKNEMVTLRDTTKGYRDSAEEDAGLAEQYKDRCEELVKGIKEPTWGDIIGDISDQSDLQDALETKQDTLVSGTNIKTLNNESLLGEGNIDINSAQWGNIIGNISDQSDLQTALQQAGTPDDATITKTSENKLQALGVIEKNKGNVKYDWIGTSQEYKDQNVAELHPTWLCHITDDTDTGTDLLQMIYPVGSLYLTTNATCPLANLFGTWVQEPNIVNDKFIIETYIDEANGGYRIWNDGWCEQWGIVLYSAGSTGQKIPLKKTYTNVSFNALCSCTDWSGQWVAEAMARIIIESQSSIIIQSGASKSPSYHMWKTSGYLASDQYTHINIPAYNKFRRIN